MGLFDLPRIHVWGRHVVNPGTGNNDSASPGTELSVVSNTERVRAITEGRTDEAFRAWMTGLDKYGLLRCQWNYYGDFSFRFSDVRVQSVQLDADTVVTDPALDPLIGAQVYLNNALHCDTNPEGFTSTQIFADALEIRAPEAFGGTGTFLSRRPARATTRWLNWYRNVSYHGLFGLPPDGANGKLSSGGAGGASASFVCGIEVRAQDLKPGRRRTADDNEVLHKFLPTGSPVLQAFADELRKPGAKGLLFRYNLYLTFPLLSDTDLAVEFAAGRKLANPAPGLVVGTIAPWFDAEPATVAMGRHLKPTGPFANPYRPTVPYYLSPAIACVNADTKHVAIDLANVLPDDGPDGDKYNLGTVTLGVRKPTPPGQDPARNGGEVLTIGTIVNDRATYVTRGGLVDIPYGATGARTRRWLEDDAHELVLQTSLHGVLLAETPYMVASDQACCYVDDLPPGQSWGDPAVRKALARQPSAALRGTFDLHMRHRGRIPSGTTTIKVEQWKETPTGYVNEYGVYRYPTLIDTDAVTVSGGVGRYVMTPKEGTGLRIFRLVPPGNYPQDIAPDTLAQLAFQEFFTELRVLPWDDYSPIAAEDVTFDVIYREIFRYYDLILPAMSDRLDMSTASLWTTPTAARYVLRMIDPAIWHTYNYMPRTRDLSASRRALLARFCEGVINRYVTNADGEAPARPAARR